MANKAHAILSASASERWLNCPPSARLNEAYEDVGSDYAIEGTCAHELCEFRTKRLLGLPADDPTEDLTYFDQEMSECADSYASFILEKIEGAKKECSDVTVLIEQRVDFSTWVDSGFGTADCLIIADKMMHVIDFKYGKGIEVSAENNSQMMCYALGALCAFDCLYDIEEAEMTIFQPRRSNISTFLISKADLYKWADEILKPAADLAFAGKGAFKCGKWCTFCKAKSECRERARYNLGLAQYEFKQPPLLTDEDVEEILPRLDGFLSWAADIKDYALRQAAAGKNWEGFKLVEGRSNRRYTDEAKVASTVSEAGFDPYEKKLLGITAMQKLLGKNRFEELLSPFLEKPPGKPVLVPVTDKRPQINTAINDFNEQEDR